ncbi:MAG: ATP-binding cassette domain-containing protein [Cyanobacteria bacterium SZAS LIN-2]|nr:ATP-binding cassette domain-containing protein [Cyanobacteria bacterium SZAS LIN-2]
MEKFWHFVKSFTPLKAVGAVASLLSKIIDLLLWLLSFLLPVLRPLGKVLLFFARLTRLNRVLNWEDLVIIAKPYWVSESRNRALALLFATLFCMVATAKAAYYFGDQLKVINDAVNAHVSDQEFYVDIGWLAGIAAIWTLVGGAYGYFRSYLALDWRVWMSRMYMRQYVRNEAYLRLQISNPDQRLAQDPDTFANTTIWLAMILIETVVNLYTFAPVLYQNSKLLTACCIGCALASYVAVLWLGRELPSLTNRQYDSEASLRTSLQDGPRYGASIALQRSEPLFLAQSTNLLGSVKQVLARVMRVNLLIGFYNTFSGKIVEQAALVGMGWLVMHGRATMGQIAQAGQAFTAVYNGLTVFTSQYGAYSTLKVELERLGPVSRALEDIGENRMPQGQWIEYAEGNDDVIRFDHVTILSSYLDAKPVVNDMTVAFDVDTLITGRDGHGKTDLAKAIGLRASNGAGKITRPPRDKVMFLTQSPYLPTCTLREYLLDMQPSGPGDDQKLLNVLELVGLPDLVEQSKGEKSGGLDTAHAWKSKISEPQQQQLCLARAILFKPMVLVIDQATDGLEPEIEEDIFQVLRGLGVRLITMSNSSRLAKSHKRVIELREDRSFEKYDSKDYKAPGWKANLRRWGGNGG